MAEVDRVEHVGRAAAAAVLGVGGVGHPGSASESSCTPKYTAPSRSRPRSATIGSSALSTSRAAAPALRAECRGPALGDVLELAVAVELVAEEVAEKDRAGVDLRGDVSHPQLVDLEQPQLAGYFSTGACGGEQGRGDAAGHVRTGGVVH